MGGKSNKRQTERKEYFLLNERISENTERLRREKESVKSTYEMVSNFSVKEGAWNLQTRG